MRFTYYISRSCWVTCDGLTIKLDLKPQLESNRPIWQLTIWNVTHMYLPSKSVHVLQKWNISKLILKGQAVHSLGLFIVSKWSQWGEIISEGAFLNKFTSALQCYQGILKYFFNLKWKRTSCKKLQILLYKLYHPIVLFKVQTWRASCRFRAEKSHKDYDELPFAKMKNCCWESEKKKFVRRYNFTAYFSD